MLFNQDKEPLWLSDWPLFRNELSTNFGSFDPVGEAEAEIEGLSMPENSWVTLYFVEFNRLAACLQWGNSALLRQAYKGLARRIKNEMVHHEKPTSLLALRKLVQSIDSQYWERKAEVARGTHSRWVNTTPGRTQNPTNGPGKPPNLSPRPVETLPRPRKRGQTSPGNSAKMVN